MVFFWNKELKHYLDKIDFFNLFEIYIFTQTN